MVDINTVLQGDCHKILKDIPDSSIDFVLFDPPYGTTRNSWDKPLDLSAVWQDLKRVSKANACIAIFSQHPFTADVANSNRRWLKYEWIWHKQNATGHLNAKIAPMKAHENILIFYKKQPKYDPQKLYGYKPSNRFYKKSTDLGCYGASKGVYGGGNTDRYPTTIIDIGYRKDEEIYMPTQKPVDLYSHFIKTYTSRGDTVLDITAGVLTTAVACTEENRSYICIEKEEKHIKIGKQRIMLAEQSVYKILGQRENEAN